MEFLEKMKSRYTVKKYDASSVVSIDELDELKSILHLSPSSTNSQPWNFVFVTDLGMKQQLAEASYFNKERILESSNLIVFRVIKRVSDFEEQNSIYNIPGAIDYYNTFLRPLGNEYIKYWMRHQVYLSLGILLAACAQMGIDSTPMEGIVSEQYDAILNNDKYETLFAVCIGKRAETDQNQPQFNPKSRLPLENVLVEL